jgi:dipeptidyl-peptidase 4
MRNLLLLLFFLPLSTLAQNKKITLDDLYKNRTFQSEQVRGFTAQQEAALFDPQEVKDEMGKVISTNDYELSADKKYIIFLMAGNLSIVIPPNQPPIFMM